MDHVFFVLQKSTQRALLTSNTNAVCAAINIVITCLTRDYKSVKQRSYSNLTKLDFAKITSRTIWPTECGKHAPHPRHQDQLHCKQLGISLIVQVVLNNLEVSSEYTLQLKKEIETECERIFGTLDAKVKSCCDDLSDTSEGFKKLLQVTIRYSPLTM